MGELPLSLQPELLRVVQEGSYKRVGDNTWRSSRCHRQLALRIAARHVEPGPMTPGDVPDEERPTDGAWVAEQRIDGLLDEAVEAALHAGRGYREIRDAAADTAVRLAIRRAGNDLQEAARRLGVTDRMVQKWHANGRAPAST